MALAWYVARTRPFAEYRAKDHLERMEIECFLPAASTPSPRRGREDAPLFPGYLFTRYNLEQWGTGALRWGPGLAGLVAFGGVAPSVPDEVIDELRERVVEIDKSGGRWNRFHPGDPVVVRLGSRGTESLAEVVTDAKSPTGRVWVLLEFLGRLAHAEVPWQNLRPAPGGYGANESGAYLPHRRTRGRGRFLRAVGPGGPQNGRSSS